MAEHPAALTSGKAGFAAAVIEDATGAVDLDGSLARAWDGIAMAGARRVQPAGLLA
jgi:nicotinamidase/pyrazinamidase